MPDTMALEVPGGDMIAWISALIDAGPHGIAHDGKLDFARDRREVVVEGRAIELTPLEAQVLGELSIVRRPWCDGRISSRASGGVPMSAATLSIRWCGRCARSSARDGIAFTPYPRRGIAMSGRHVR